MLFVLKKKIQILVLLFFMELPSLLFFLGGNCQAWVPFCMLMVCVCVCVGEGGYFFLETKMQISVLLFFTELQSLSFCG